VSCVKRYPLTPREVFWALHVTYGSVESDEDLRADLDDMILRISQKAVSEANSGNMGNLSRSTGKHARTPKELPDRWGPVVSEYVVRQVGLLAQSSLDRLASNDNDCRKQQ
jgi:hypothetical protein